MATIAEMRSRFQALQGKEMEFAAQALQESEVTAMNLVAGQLAQGIKSDGSLVPFSYTPFTIASKKNKTGLARVTDHLTNYDTGESYANMYMNVKGSDIEFGTKTDKENAIMDRMDGEAFRPTKESKEILIKEETRPKFVKKIRDFVKL